MAARVRLDPQRFVPPLPKHLHCAKCGNAAYPPAVVCSNEHLMCHECVEIERIDNPHSPTCATCSKRIRVKAPVSIGLTRAIDSYKYSCKHDKCGWVGGPFMYGDHTRRCEYRRIKCADCALRYPMNNPAKHFKSDCLEAIVKCDRQQCPAGGSLRRREWAAHEEICCMDRCSIPGCPTRTTKGNMPAHEAGCLLVHQRVKDLELQIDVVTSALRVERAQAQRRRGDGDRPAAEAAAEPEAEEQDEFTPAPALAHALARTSTAMRPARVPIVFSMFKPADSPSTAADVPSPKRRRTSLAPVDNTASTSASSSSTTAKRPFKVHVVDLEEGTDEMIEL
ncbi:hypothetical protein JCM9279_006722 [Rhodotorula babjevae]